MFFEITILCIIFFGFATERQASSVWCRREGLLDCWNLRCIQRIIISFYVIVMGIFKCEQVFAGTHTFSSVFEIKIKVFSHRTNTVRWEITRKSKNPCKNIFACIVPITITYIVFFSILLNLFNTFKNFKSFKHVKLVKK